MRTAATSLKFRPIHPIVAAIRVAMRQGTDPSKVATRDALAALALSQGRRVTSKTTKAQLTALIVS